MEEQRQEEPVSAAGSSGKNHSHSKHNHKHRKQNKFQKFFKKHKNLIVNLIIILIAIVAVVLMGLFGDSRNLSGRQPGGNTENTAPSQTEEPVTTIQIELRHFSDDVLLISNAAHSFANRDMSVPLMEAIHRYASTESRQDLGLPVSLSYSVNSIPSGLTIEKTTLEVADNPEFTDSRVFTSSGDTNTVPVSHLQTGTKYYYRVGVVLSDNTTTYAVSTFETAASPRILTIEGIHNVRDVGGWKTTDGKTVKQGLLYRGTELDGAVEAGFKLTSDGRNDMLTILGIRTEMDLRSPDDITLGTHPLGANVQHTYYSAKMYSQVLSPENYVTTRKIFSDLADADNYPVYMHCTYGADRTGTMCYLLLNLLGVSEEDARRDYELSALYYAGADSEAMDAFVSDLQTLPGETMQEKVENYLISIGVTEQEITEIRNILLEE